VEEVDCEHVGGLGAQELPPAGATAARVVRVDDTHLVLILEFASAQDADRVATDVGGPWMRERILPLLARGPERSVGEVIARRRRFSSPGATVLLACRWLGTKRQRLGCPKLAGGGSVLGSSLLSALSTPRSGHVGVGRVGAAQHGDLVAQRQDLDVLGGI
jgi:hypothetical protein